MDSTLKQIDKNIAKGLAQAKKSNLDISTLTQSITDERTSLTTSRDTFNTDLQAGQGDNLNDEMQNFSDQINSINEDINTLNSLGNMSRFVKNLQTGLKNAPATIAKLTAKKLDTTQLQDIQDLATAKMAEIQTAMAQKTPDTSSLMGMFSEMSDLRAEFQNEVDSLTGTQSTTNEPAISQPQGFAPFTGNNGSSGQQGNPDIFGQGSN